MKETARTEKLGEDLQTQVKLLKTELEEVNKKSKEKDNKISQLQQDLADVSEDRSQMQNVLKSLSERVGNATETQSKMDADFAKVNQDKIQLKTEAREWQQKYDRLEKEMKENLETEQKKKKRK